VRWSYKLGEVAGIGIFVHATFLILIGWLALSAALEGHGAVEIFSGIGFIAALFGCVLLHELGHALSAKRFGIRTRDITLLPIGGVARLERMPKNPLQELLVALAGPAVNVGIAAALFGAIALRGGAAPIGALGVFGGPFLERLFLLNVVMALFNLIPAFPMDGGRVLRALLATRMEYTRATQIAAATGQAFALLFGFIGLLGNPFLIFIAFFVWIGAAQEAAMTQMRSALAGIPVHRAMLTDFRTLSPEDTLGRASELLLAGSQQDFPVVEAGRVVGMLPRKALLTGLAKIGREGRAADVMETSVPFAHANEMLEPAFLRLRNCDCHALPVTREGELVGLLTPENVGELVMIQAALGAREGERPKPWFFG
jgi:Zn-dependent protease/CBS domain-containing protein